MSNPLQTVATLAAAADATAPHQVTGWITWLFFVLLVAMIACLALEEKLHAKKSVIVGAFAVVSLLLGAFLHVLPFGYTDVKLPGDHVFHLPVFIPAVEWSVITIILGSSLFVDVTSKSGLFTWIAIKFTKLSRGDPLILLIYYCVMTVVFSAVLNNVTAMIIVGSLSAVSLGKLGRRDKLLAFLLIEGLLTNIGGLLTLISSVPNIIVGTTAGISFVTFFIKAAPYVAVATAATVWLGAKVFQIRRLTDADEIIAARQQVDGFDENDGVESVGFFWFAAAMLVAFIVFIAGASFDGWPVGQLGMGFVAMAFGVVMLIRYKHDVGEFYQAVDWDLLFFFVFLFVTIFALEMAGVLALIGTWIRPILGLGETTGGGLLLVASSVASSVTDNIPLAAMLAKILKANPDVSFDSRFWWSVIFGANLGGNLTPIGSASTLVAVTIMHKHELKMTFIDFIKAALPFAALHIVLAVAYVLVVL